MEVDRVSPSVEKPFRKALGHAIRNEIDELLEHLAGVEADDLAKSLELCAFVTAYVASDVCGRQWPNDSNRRKIAEASTESSQAQAFGLTAEDSYTYLARVALGFEVLDKVFPDPQTAVSLSFVIAGNILVGFCPEELEWWEYLNRIEVLFETSHATDLDLLPALMWRSRKLGNPRVFGEIPR